MAYIFAILFAFIIAGTLGTKRKIGFGWSLVACLLLSPIIGLIITLCTAKLPEKQEAVSSVDEKPLAEVLTETINEHLDTAGGTDDASEVSNKTDYRNSSSAIDY